MAQVYLTIDAGPPATARLYIRGAGSTTVSQLTLPGGVSAVSRKPDILPYRRRTYYNGSFSRMLIRDEYAKLRPGGVRPPRTTPTITNGSFVDGTPDEIIVAYQTFVVKQGGVKISESNPGAASNVLTSTGTGRAYFNLDNAPEDAHVTHSRIYLSVDGEVPFLALEIPLPHLTTAAENTATTALGEPLPVRIDPSGTTVLDRYARGVPPYTKFAEIYHDAMWWAGDPNHPERIYPGRLFEPEACNTTAITVNGRTEEPWLSTTDGMPVTGLRRQGDELVVGTLRGIDVIQGYSPGDYTIRRASNYWGVLSHHSMRRAGPLGSLWFAAPQGPTLYNAGAFRFAGEPIETWWLDNFRLYPEVFENCYGAEDRFSGNYRLLIPQYPGFGTACSFYINCDYFGAEIGQPVWVADRRARNDQSMGELISDDSNLQYDLNTGSCDGYIRRENVESNADDDGDSFRKRFTVRTAHRFPRGQQGDQAHGNTYTELDLFLKHNDQAATLKMWAGDDDAPSAASPQWTPVAEGPESGSPATAVASGERAKVKQTSEHHALRDLAGKGVTLEVQVEAPIDVEYRGCAIGYLPSGPQTRPFA